MVAVENHAPLFSVLRREHDLKHPVVVKRVLLVVGVVAGLERVRLFDEPLGDQGIKCSLRLWPLRELLCAPEALTSDGEEPRGPFATVVNFAAGNAVALANLAWLLYGPPNEEVQAASARAFFGVGAERLDRVACYGMHCAIDIDAGVEVYADDPVAQNEAYTVRATANDEVTRSGERKPFSLVVYEL